MSISFPAVAGVKWGISKILLNTDTASEGWIERPIGTVQWRFKLPANVAPFMLEDYGLTNANQGFAVIISQSTTKCYANIKAYSIS